MKISICAFLIMFTVIFNPYVLEGLEHSGPKYSTDTYKSLDAFATQFAKEHDLKFQHSSVGRGKKSIWYLSLTSAQAIKIEEARELATELTYQLLYHVYHTPCFAKYCQVHAKNYPKRYTDQIEENFVGFRIAFWDQKTNRPLFPYLAQISLQDGNLYFYYADPKTQALLDPIVESLESLKLKDYRS